MNSLGHTGGRASMLLGLSSNATPLGGITTDEINNVLDSLAQTKGSVTPVLLDYCSLLHLPSFEKSCRDRGVEGLAGTRICVEKDQVRVGELCFVAKNQAGLEQLVELINKVNRHPHNIKKVNYGKAQSSVGDWQYFTMSLEDLEIVSGGNVAVMVSPLTPQLSDVIKAERERGVNVELIANISAPSALTKKGIENGKVILHLASLSNSAQHDIYFPTLIKKSDDLNGGLPKWYTEKNLSARQSVNYLMNYWPQAVAALDKHRNYACNSFLAECEQVRVLAPEKLPAARFELDVIGEARRVLEGRLSADPSLDALRYRNYLEQEISILEKIGGVGYYQTVIEFCNYVKENHSECPIRVRGSATSSLILNLLGVSSPLNCPVKNNLLIQRFISPNRVELPDIDLDIPPDMRTLFVEFAEKNFGKGSAMSFLTASTKQNFEQVVKAVAALLRDSGRDVPTDDEIGSIYQRACDEVGAYSSDDRKLTQLLGRSEIIREEISKNPDFSALMSMSVDYSAYTRSYSSHPSGVLIATDKDASQTSCLTKNGASVVCCLKPSMVGQVKFDILASNHLQFLRVATSLLRETAGVDYNPPRDDDSELYEFLVKNGAFLTQMGGKTFQGCVAKIKPKNMQELLISMALARPLMDFKDRDEFYKRWSGVRPRTPQAAMFENQKVKEILEPTCGYILFDEQILEICYYVAKLDDGVADQIRSAIKKGKMDVFESLRPNFVGGVVGTGASEVVGHQVFDLLKKSVGKYSFCKAHAQSYASIAIEEAWFKRYHPAIALAAILNAFDVNKKSSGALSADSTAFEVLINEYQQRGLVVAPPSLNMSNVDVHADKDGRIYTPLRQLFLKSDLYANDLLDIVDKIKSIKKDELVTLKDFIDLSAPAFVRTLRVKRSIVAPESARDAYVKLVTGMICKGAFDDVRFMQAGVISDCRYRAREALLSVAHEYMVDKLSVVPTGSVKLSKCTISPDTIRALEHKAFGVSFSDQPNNAAATVAQAYIRQPEQPSQLQAPQSRVRHR